MHNYVLDDKYLYYSSSITRGTQPKYKKGDYFYKRNKFGNEGFTEYLVSRLLKHSSLPHYAFVDYEYCKINGVLGCRSKNFLSTENEELITINAIYQRLTGDTDLSNTLSALNNLSDRLNYVCDLVEKVGMYRPIFREYLNLLCQLDMLIGNTDRHWHNVCLIYNKVLNRWRVAPIFDNGLALDTDRSGNKASCTLCGSFETQVALFSYPVKPTFTLDYNEIYKDLSRITRYYGSHYEISMLKVQLEKYKSLFRKEEIK